MFFSGKCFPQCPSQPVSFGHSVVMKRRMVGLAIPVTEWAASDKRLHLDSSSHPPLCTLCLSGDSCRLLHLCSACKSAEQLEWPVGAGPSTPNLLLPRPPATVTELIIVLLLTPKQWQCFPSLWLSRCLNYHPQTNFETGLIISLSQSKANGVAGMMSPEIKS